MSRAAALNKLKELFKTHKNGQYAVRRGVIAWSGFDFSKTKFAVSIQVDESTPMIAMPMSTISIELATLIPDDSNDPEVDDLTLETLESDCIEVIRAWERAKLPNGDPYVIKLEQHSARSVEFYDATLRVQGVIFTVNVST